MQVRAKKQQKEIRMSRHTKQLQFNRRTKEAVTERDRECLFCKMHYHMDCKSPMLYQIKDIMHYIPKSSSGLGIEENGVLGCRYHHGLLDNGSRGLREEMLKIMENHLKACYPEWDRDKLKYQKYDF